MHIFDETKHLRGYHGRWAKGADRSFDARGKAGPNGVRGKVAAPVARQRKAGFTAKVRGLLDTRDRVARGERVNWRDEQNVAWSSPKKIDEQRRKTGDALIPRAEIARKARSQHRSASDRDTRTGVKRSFSGKPVAVRGNYRTVEVPSKRGGTEIRIDGRVRRSIDWGGKTKATKKSKPKPTEYVGRRRAQP